MKSKSKTAKKKAAAKKMTAEQKRLARNEYSRQWKADHAKEVKQWNKNWYEHKAKATKKKATKKKRVMTTAQPEKKAA